MRQFSCWQAEAGTDITDGVETDGGRGRLEVAAPDDDACWRGHVKRDRIRGGVLIAARVPVL